MDRNGPCPGTYAKAGTVAGNRSDDAFPFLSHGRTRKKLFLLAIALAFAASLCIMLFVRYLRSTDRDSPKPRAVTVLLMLQPCGMDRHLSGLHPKHVYCTLQSACLPLLPIPLMAGFQRAALKLPEMEPVEPTSDQAAQG